jgi:hypothetical protein
MLACEVTHVDPVLLRRVDVFFVIEVATRRVHLLGVIRHPSGQLAAHCARDFATESADRAESFRFLVRDRDAKFTAVFDAGAAEASVAEHVLAAMFRRGQSSRPLDQRSVAPELLRPCDELALNADATSSRLAAPRFVIQSCRCTGGC